MGSRWVAEWNSLPPLIGLVLLVWKLEVEAKAGFLVWCVHVLMDRYVCHRILGRLHWKNRSGRVRWQQCSKSNWEFQSDSTTREMWTFLLPCCHTSFKPVLKRILDSETHSIWWWYCKRECTEESRKFSAYLYLLKLHPFSPYNKKVQWVRLKIKPLGSKGMSACLVQYNLLYRVAVSASTALLPCAAFSLPQH